MEKINSLTGMTDLIETKADENVLANKVFQTEKILKGIFTNYAMSEICLLYTSPSPRDRSVSRMPSSA